MKKHFILLVLMVLVFSVSCFGGQGSKTQVTSQPTSVPDEYFVPHQKPGPAVNKIEFASTGVDQAVAEVEAGNIDLYLFNLKISAARTLDDKSDLKTFRAPSGQISILLNPAPAPPGQLNPFSIPEVRRAVNYLIDRQQIVQEIYGGFAVSMVSHVSPLDYDYLTVYDILASRNITFDFEYAKQEIARAMKTAGAELVNGKWYYNGKPIRLKFIIRVEDERRDVGDLIRVALEKAGFEVQPIYMEFAPAIFTVYTSDPQAFNWHLYTEGWGKGSPDRYDFATINQMAAPWMGNMPGWQIVGFWQYRNDKLDELGKKLFTGDFKSREERDIIYKQMTEIALDEAVRIWVATTFSTFPANNELLGVTEDLVAGPRGFLALREAFVPGKDYLRIGNLWVWTERTAWNPVGGFSDVYSVDIWKNIVDPPFIQHPFSGIPVPFRVSFELETAGPDGKLSVPEDAVIWDAIEDRWVPVPPNTTATSKVIFDYSRYFQSKWHHGQPITMADVLHGIYQIFEITYDPDKSRIEFVVAATSKPLLDTFKGFRVLDENRLEVYVDYWHFEQNYIAAYANLASLSMPWEILAASDLLVFERNLAAYSQSAAARMGGVPWLSLVMRKDSSMVAGILRNFEATNFVPHNVFSILPSQVEVNATDRYQAAIDWFEKYNHLVISQGPFYLSRYIPEKNFAELLAFRDPNYPFKPGDWYLGKVKTVEFVETSFGRLNGQKVLNVKLEGPGQLDLRVYVVDSGQTQELETNKVDQKEFEVVLPNNTKPTSQLVLLASSDKVALVSSKQLSILD